MAPWVKGHCRGSGYCCGAGRSLAQKLLHALSVAKKKKKEERQGWEGSQRMQTLSGPGGGPGRGGLRWPPRELGILQPCSVGEDIMGYRKGIWGFPAFPAQRWMEEEGSRAGGGVAAAAQPVLTGTLPAVAALLVCKLGCMLCSRWSSEGASSPSLYRSQTLT